ncbi:MAG: hypothetical protein NTZ61_03480, partial [Proteobacteria bacterium]|nr:hypothetical protein [Pseudomonadota bacterium]
EGGKSGEEIEAEYLEEERLAIKNDQSVGPSRAEPRKEREAVIGAEGQRAVEVAPRRIVLEPLPVLIGRLQALWTRPMEVPEKKDAQTRRERGSSCASPSWCGDVGWSEGESMNDVRICASDDPWGHSPGLDPREVS